MSSVWVSRSVKLFARRHASVAAVLRSAADDTLELLLIQRVASTRDRWSAHVALPGGIVQSDDASDLAAAIRECAEEVGLDLSDTGRFELLGQLDDRLATSSLAVSTFLFKERSSGKMSAVLSAQGLKLQDREVACAWWVSLALLRSEEVVDSRVPASAYLPRFFHARPWLVRALGVEEVLTRSIPLPWRPAAGVPLPPPSKSSPFLWGLTFGIVSDVRAALGMRPLRARLELRPNVRFAPLLHPANLLIGLLRLSFAVRSLAMRSRTLSSLLQSSRRTS